MSETETEFSGLPAEISEEPSEAQAQPAEDSQEQPQQQQPANNKPAGYYPIDFATATPDQVKERYDYIYRQVKDGERERRETNRVLKEQSRLIDELSSGMGQVVNHIQENTFDNTEATLKANMRAAYEAGNTDAYLEAQDKLDELRLEKKLAERDRKAIPQPQQKQVAQPQNDPMINTDESRVINDWQSERDESGVLLRPWAHNKSTDPNSPDQEFLYGLAETRAVFQNPRFADLSIHQKIAEVDRRMGVKKPGSGQSVMGGGLTTNRKSSKITLTPKQQEIAIKTRFGGPKAKSDTDHLEAYRKQIERVQTTKGARS